MTKFGITLDKETHFFEKRSKKSALKEVLNRATALFIIEKKHREGNTWLEVQKLDEQKTRGFILEDKPSQIEWLHLKSTASSRPLHELVNNNFVKTDKMLFKGDRFHIIYTNDIFSSIFFHGKNYILIGPLKAEAINDWSPKSIIYYSVLLICLMYGAIILAPEWYPSGRYPSIILFFPGLLVAIVVMPIIWLLFYVAEEIQKRT